MSKMYKLGIGAGFLLGIAIYFFWVWLLPIMGQWDWIIT